MKKRRKYALVVGELAPPTLLNVSGLPLGVGPGGRGSGIQARPMILTINTQIGGVSATNQYKLPLRPGESYNFIATINGVDLPVHTTDVSPTYTFPSEGQHNFEIRGADDSLPLEGFSGIYVNNTDDTSKLITIVQWGSMQWTSFESAFYGCSLLTAAATDEAPIGTATDFSSCFRNCTQFFSIGDNWDFSNATDLHLFARSSGIVTFAPASHGDNILDMSEAFRAAQSLVTIGTFSTSSCTNINSMCSSATKLTDISGFTNLSSVITGNTAFFNIAITEVPALNLVSCTSAGIMFENCSDLVTVNRIIWGSLSNASGLFKSCPLLATFNGVMDFSTVTNASELCRNNDALTTVPNWFFNACTNMNTAFANMTELLTLPGFNGSTGNVTTMNGCCSTSRKLTNMPDWNYSNVTNFSGFLSESNSIVHNPARVLTLKAGASINCSSMFRANSLMTVGMIFVNDSSITNHNAMYSFTAVSVLPDYDYTRTTNMAGYFQASDLIEVTSLDCPLNTTFGDAFGSPFLTEFTGIGLTPLLNRTSYMFGGSANLVTVGLFDTASVTDAANMFTGCSSLKTLPAFDWSSCTNFVGFLNNVTLDRIVYDNLLTALVAGGQSNVTLDAPLCNYTSPSADRATLISRGWTINDGDALAYTIVYDQEHSGDLQGEPVTISGLQGNSFDYEVIIQSENDNAGDNVNWNMAINGDGSREYNSAKMGIGFAFYVLHSASLDFSDNFAGCAWVQPNNRNQNQYIMGKSDTGTYSWNLFIRTSGKLAFTYSLNGTTTTTFTSTFDVPISSKTLVHFRVTGGTLFIGTNGSTNSTFIGTLATNTWILEFGTINQATGISVDLHMSQAILFNTGMSASTFTTIFNLGNIPKYSAIPSSITDDCVMSIALNSSDTSLVDLSGTGNNGIEPFGPYENGTSFRWQVGQLQNYRVYETVAAQSGFLAEVTDTADTFAISDSFRNDDTGLIKLRILGEVGEETWINSLAASRERINISDGFWKNTVDELISLTFYPSYPAGGSAIQTGNSRIIVYAVPKNADQGNWDYIGSVTWTNQLAPFTFIGLLGNTDIQYKAIWNGDQDLYAQINGVTGPAYHQEIFHNSNGFPSASNGVYGAATIPNSTRAELIINAETRGGKRVFSASGAASASPVDQAKTGCWWGNSVDEITTITFGTDIVTTGKVKLYKRSALSGDTLPFEIIQSFDIAGVNFINGLTYVNLTGNSVQMYKIEFWGTVSVNDLVMLVQFNNETSFQYIRQDFLVDGSTIDANINTGANDLQLGNLEAGTETHSVMYIYPKAGGKRVVLNKEISEEVIIEHSAQWWKNSVDELTSMKIFASNGNVMTGKIEISVLQ